MSSMPPICGSSASKNKPEHCESHCRWVCSAPWVCPRHDPDRRVRLRVRRLFRPLAWQCRVPVVSLINRQLAFAAETCRQTAFALAIPEPTFAVTQRGLRRCDGPASRVDARASVTSVMLVLAEADACRYGQRTKRHRPYGPPRQGEVGPVSGLAKA